MCYIQHKFDMNCRTWRVKYASLIIGGSKHEIYELLNVHLKTQVWHELLNVHLKTHVWHELLNVRL